MDRETLIKQARHTEAWHAPKRVPGSITPRHRLVAQARLTLRVLDPEVKVWGWRLERQETGLHVLTRQRYRLDKIEGRSDLV